MASGAFSVLISFHENTTSACIFSASRFKTCYLNKIIILSIITYFCLFSNFLCMASLSPCHGDKENREEFRVIHEHNTIVSAPRLTISAALVTAFSQGTHRKCQNQLFRFPFNSVKCPFLSLINLKSVVPGQISSVMHLINLTSIKTSSMI